MGPEGTLHLNAVDYLGAGPTLGRAQDYGRPSGTARETFDARILLELSDGCVTVVECLGEFLVHAHRLAAFHEVHVVAMATQIVADILVGIAAENRRPRNFVAIEMKDRQHRTVMGGI